MTQGPPEIRMKEAPPDLVDVYMIFVEGAAPIRLLADTDLLEQYREQMARAHKAGKWPAVIEFTDGDEVVGAFNPLSVRGVVKFTERRQL